jgi:hypothetical protein
MSLPHSASSSSERWPSLPYDAWKDTYATLHMWTQVVGKVALARAAPLNHSWAIALHLTPRGLTTGVLPDGRRSFTIAFDFIDHQLIIDTSDGVRRTLPLAPRSVAAFYAEVMAMLQEMGLPVRIWSTPVEIATPIPFEQDTVHQYYDPEYVDRLWRILVQVHRVFTDSRCNFIGKSSPVHFFWGSFDLAVTRFSGRRAPPHPGGVPNLPDWVAREAYSHEVSSAGFWPGGPQFPEAIFYSYAYPEPNGFRGVPVRPAAARFDPGLGEFVLPYANVRAAADPEDVLLEFLQSTYEAAAERGGWDRESLEATFPPEAFRNVPAELR